MQCKAILVQGRYIVSSTNSKEVYIWRDYHLMHVQSLGIVNQIAMSEDTLYCKTATHLLLIHLDTLQIVDTIRVGGQLLLL